MGRRVIFTTSSTEETFSFGKNLGETAPGGSLFALFGDLGAGKTTLIKGIVFGATGTHPQSIVSPTYSYMRSFPSNKKNQISAYHFDLYRLFSANDFFALGFDEYLNGENSICCIEWSERISSVLPNNHIPLYLSHIDSNRRKIEGVIPWLP